MEVISDPNKFIYNRVMGIESSLGNMKREWREKSETMNIYNFFKFCCKKELKIDDMDRSRERGRGGRGGRGRE